MSTAGALGFAAWPCLQPIAGANSRTDRLAGGVGGALVRRRQHVLVEVGGDRAAGMPEPLGHARERLAGRQRRGRIAVAHAVQGDRRQAAVPHQPRTAW
jgi:hypothetical protein